MKLKTLSIIAVIVTLMGCGSHFAYKNLDWLAYWYFDDYIQLTDQQKAIVDPKLAAWLSWHRQEELPKYLSSLNALRSDIRTQQLNIETLNGHQEALRQHWHRIKVKLVPDLVQLAPILDNQQISDFFDKLDEKNIEEREDIKERSQHSGKQQQKEAIKRYKKALSPWIGQLTAEQETMIITLYNQLQPSENLWLAYRETVQAQLKNLLDQPDRTALFDDLLFELLMTPETLRSDALNLVNTHNASHFKAFLLNMAATTTDDQLEKLLNEIDDLAKETAALMK